MAESRYCCYAVITEKLTLINVDTLYHAFIMAERFYNYIWLKIHHCHYFQGEHENIIIPIITWDLIVAGLTRYTIIWKKIFGDRLINVGISGDCVENVLWCASYIPFLLSLQDVVILCGTNNINKDFLYDIIRSMIAIGSVFKKQSMNPNVFIYGILSRDWDETSSVNRLIINEKSDLLISKCSVKKICFIKENNG